MTQIDRRQGVYQQAAIKLPCRVVATTNITLEGLQTIDGVTLVADDRVLVAGQTDTTEVGIYAADTGEWQRTADFDGPRDVVQGTFTIITSGTLYGESVWRVTTADPLPGEAMAFELMGASALSVASAFMLTVLDDPSASAARTTLGAVGLTGTDVIAGTKTFSDAVNFDGAVDFDGTVDATGSSSFTVPTAATTPVAAGHNTTAASTAFVQTILAATKPVGGLLWSVNAGDATNDIDISVGAMADTTGTFILRLASAITKRLDASWAVGTGNGGLDTGAVGNSEYYGWLIARSDTGVVDFLWSLSATAPTMPANYDFKAGPCAWVKRSGGANLAWKTYETAGGGVDFVFVTPIRDVNLANTLTTTRRTDALSVPKNFSTRAMFRVYLFDASNTSQTVICNPDETDVAPSSTDTPGANVFSSTSADGVEELSIRTSATGTIASRSLLATVDNYIVVTLGFQWSRR